MSLPSAVIPFVKASACGNDFLLIDASILAGDLDRAALTRRMCDRRNGVGADGVEWMYPHPTADIEIHLINSDGSYAEISGNGTRCVAAYICASQKKDKIVIQTGAGLKTCVLTGRSESEYAESEYGESGYEFEVAMGEAVVGNEERVNLSAGEVRGIPVSIGNPHFVLFVPEFADNWKETAAEIQNSPQFTGGVNIEMVVIDGIHDVRVRFFERGVGETQSSGTGSCAAAMAALSTGKVESPVSVHAPGGIQMVRREGKDVFLRGAARLVCQGEFFLSNGGVGV
ncbi:MAG: diaminopimelate epimerase [Candidatus Sulfotelmatobacter sp.]